MSPLARFFLTGAAVLPAMVLLLHQGESSGALAVCFATILLVATMVAKVIHDENEAETPEHVKERERRAEMYTVFGRKNGDDE